MRAAQACFLTRGDLYVSWERGRDTFDRLLIDGDPSINSANWFGPMLILKLLRPLICVLRSLGQ